MAYKGYTKKWELTTASSGSSEMHVYLRDFRQSGKLVTISLTQAKQEIKQTIKQ
jgi:hypothetical protein